ncbi:MAG: CoA transferase, partial [Mycobacterium sp.]
MPTPLSGLRVVEIGDRLATAYAGKLLRDAGADVVMVEPP